MFRSTLVAQLLTLLLDSQGADVTTLREVFPEEFSPGVESSERPRRHGFPYLGASADLNDSLRYLLEHHLARVAPDGRIRVEEETITPAHVSLSQRDEGFLRPMFEWDDLAAGPAGPLEPFAFELPRGES